MFIFNFDSTRHSSYSEQVENLDFETSNYILSLGSVFLVLSYLILRTLFYYFLRLLMIRFPKNEKIKDYAERVGKNMFWNKFLVVLQGSYIELMIASYIAIENPVYQSTFNMNAMKNGEVVSYYLAMLTLPVIYLIVPGIAIWVMFQSKFHLKVKDNTFGVMYRNQKIATIW